MPAGFRTEGPRGKGSEFHPEFAVLYGARELPGADYPTRSRANVRDSDATLWFGCPDTCGARVTLLECCWLGRPTFLVRPGADTRPSAVVWWLGAVGPRVLNVAGNRASTAPDLGPRVERFLTAVFRRLGRPPTA